MKTDVKLTFSENGKFPGLVKAARELALGAAINRAREKLVKDERLPYRTGRLTVNTKADLSEMKGKGLARLVSSAPYAARLYMHPEYKFRKKFNKNAGGRWFDQFINGAEKGFLEAEYAKEMARLIK